MHSTRNDIAAATRKKLCAILNQNLADTIDLGLQAKQAHWNVKGPNFISLHELFDKVAAAAQAAGDELAERVTALGGVAEGTIQVVEKKTRLDPYPLNISDGKKHVQKLADAMAAVGKSARAAIDETDELGDKDTADLFTEISRELDKLLWFVEAHVQADE